MRLCIDVNVHLDALNFLVSNLVGPVHTRQRARRDFGFGKLTMKHLRSLSKSQVSLGSDCCVRYEKLHVAPAKLSPSMLRACLVGTLLLML